MAAERDQGSESQKKDSSWSDSYRNDNLKESSEVHKIDAKKEKIESPLFSSEDEGGGEDDDGEDEDEEEVEEDDYKTASEPSTPALSSARHHSTPGSDFGKWEARTQAQIALICSTCVEI